MKLRTGSHEYPENDTADDEPAPSATFLLWCLVSHKLLMPSNAKLTDDEERGRDARIGTCD